MILLEVSLVEEIVTLNEDTLADEAVTVAEALLAEEEAMVDEVVTLVVIQSIVAIQDMDLTVGEAAAQRWQCEVAH